MEDVTRPTATPPVRRAGFSLLELILAMSVVVALSAALYASMSVAIRAKRSAEAAVMPVRSAAVAAEVVAQDLESVLPPTGVLAGAFVGAADTLDFYCVGEDAAPAAGRTDPLAEGIRHVQLALRTDTTPATLVRRVDRNVLTTVQQDPVEEVLCRNVVAFAARYFDGSAWTDTWDSTATTNNALPTAVELTLTVRRDPTNADSTFHVVRVIPLACGTNAATQTTTGGAP
jgi:prepilin-type N-terminal cleavage/methylation domain-containing protein